MTEVGCLARARRKFFDPHAMNKSQIAGFALEQFAKIYDIERKVKELSADQLQDIRQQHTKPLLDALHGGCCCSDNSCRTARPQPRRWITACGARLR